MHRPRRNTVTSSFTPSSSSTTTSHSSSTTHSRPTLGGNVGFSSGNGGAVLSTTISLTTAVPPTTLSSPILTTSSISTPPSSEIIGSNGNGDPVNGGLDSNTGTTTLPGTSDSLLGSLFPSSITGIESSARSQSVESMGVSPTSMDINGPTALQGDSSATSSVSTSSPAPTTSTTLPASSDSHRDMSSGIIAGVILFLICFFLILAFIRHRKRKVTRTEGETSEPKADREVVTEPSVYQQHEDSALVFTSPHSPSNTNYTPTLGTPQSPRWVGDSNSDISRLSLPPPTMVEIDNRAHVVPTLILDTSRYRRSPRPSPIDSQLSVVTTLSGDPRRLSRGRHHSPRDTSSHISPQSLSPSEAFCSSKPPLSYRSSSSSSRPPSQTSLQVPPSPISLRVPPSPTNLRSPPSPRTPPRTPMFIPPIPPLPKSPPPVPESYINPFMDKNPFSDPAG